MISKAQLVGSWTLESWTIGYSDREDFTSPYGENPQGLLIYSNDGWMSATINRAGRAEFPEDASPRSLPDDTVASAYNSYFSYTGRYRLADGDVVHYVSQSLYPNFVGSQQLRHAELDGQTLVLSGKDQVGETTRFHSLVWHRVPAEDERPVIDGG